MSKESIRGNERQADVIAPLLSIVIIAALLANLIAALSPDLNRIEALIPSGLIVLTLGATPFLIQRFTLLVANKSTADSFAPEVAYSAVFGRSDYYCGRGPDDFADCALC